MTAGEKCEKTVEVKLRPLEKVSTTQGNFYVRDVRLLDLKRFEKYLAKGVKKEETNLKDLGELALKTLVSTGPEYPWEPALTEGIYRKLSEADVEQLALGVAQAGGATALPPGEPLEALGSVLFDGFPSEKSLFGEQDKISESLFRKNFGTLPLSLQGALGEQIKKINTITESLRGSPAIAELQRINENLNRFRDNPFTKGGLGTMGGNSLAENSKPREFVSNPASSIPRLNVQSFPAINVADTPMGRAASASEEAAQQLREVAGLAAQMAEQVGTLHTIFLTQVLPEWKDSLQKNTANANRSLRNAVVALVISIVVAVVLAGLQLWTGYLYNSESSAQQSVSERVSKQQLDALQSIGQQLNANYEEMRSELLKYRREQMLEQTSKYFLFPKE